MSPEERADRIITAFWDYFHKSEHGFIVKDSIAKHIRKAERARDQACMAAMCPLCAEGVRPVEKRGNDLWHVSKPGQGGILLPDGHCIAQPIREMTDDDQAK